MGKAKTSTIYNIIGNGIKLYAQNLFTLSNPVVMPVIALLFGVGLMIIPIYLLPKYYPIWMESMPVLSEIYAVIIISILSLIPGLIVFKLGFWNYMLKFVSLNSMVGDILKKKVLKHHSYYTQIVALRTKDYILMLLIWCLIWLMGLALPFSIYLFNIEPALLIKYILIGLEFVAVFLLSILSIYLSLCFQVFAFETSLGPMQTLEESFRLVLNNFWRLLVMSLALYIITFVLIPQLFAFLADILMIKSVIASPIKSLLENLCKNPGFYDTLQSLPVFPYPDMEKFITEFSKIISFSIISSIISLLMLPLGSCFYTLFYFDAKKRNTPKEEMTQEPMTDKKNKKTKKK